MYLLYLAFICRLFVPSMSSTIHLMSSFVQLELETGCLWINLLEPGEQFCTIKIGNWMSVGQFVTRCNIFFKNISSHLYFPFMLQQQEK